MSELERAQRLLSTTVGPAPWYWRTFPVFHLADGGLLVWNVTEFGQGRVATLGPANAVGRVCLVANMYARVFAIPPGFLGLWHSDGHFIHVLAFDPERLPLIPLANLPPDRPSAGEGCYCEASPLAKAEVDMDLEEGEYPYHLPLPFVGVGRLMLVGDYAKAQEAACAAIFEICPGSGTGTRRLRVLPQRWFSRDRFDLGYQWITRVVRDPKSDRIYGDGIRIGVFKLTVDGCHLEQWVSGP